MGPFHVRQFIAKALPIINSAARPSVIFSPAWLRRPLGEKFNLLQRSNASEPQRRWALLMSRTALCGITAYAPCRNSRDGADVDRFEIVWHVAPDEQCLQTIRSALDNVHVWDISTDNYVIDLVISPHLPFAPSRQGKSTPLVVKRSRSTSRAYLRILRSFPANIGVGHFNN